MSETNTDKATLSVGSLLQAAAGGGESLKLKINRRRNELILVDSTTGRSARLDIEMEIEDEAEERKNGAMSSATHISSLETLFQELASQWKKETGHLSLAIKQVMHPAYQRIIGLGPAAIPLILRELQRERDHWFWALEAITGEKLTYPAGDIAQAAEVWLQWGKENRYI
ncbi:MAG: hypothetical protein ACREEM_02945 [Blastocatellia bacterium]